ncbi:MAG: fibronectin type III domain-containing protein [bacterium]|nr:fibronectin type III domain-containing protein [bacterium]
MNNYLSLSAYKKVFLFGVLSFIVVVIIAVLFFANGKVSAAASNQTAKITLNTPVSLDAFIAITENLPLDVIILESSFVFNGESVQDFYVVNTKNGNKNIKEDYIQNRKAFLADVKGIKELSSADEKNIETVLVSKATLTGQKSGIDGIRKQMKVSNVDIAGEQAASISRVNGKARPREATLFGDGVITIAAQTQPMYLSLPTSGTAYFYPSAYGGRYTQQNMRWPANYFAPEETYEHKVYLYNYDRKTYLDGTSTSYPGCYPITTYAATTWPAASYPYLDTRLYKSLYKCEIDELSYTIGAAQANAIPANVDHYTYIRTANGNDTTDKFKLQGQVGYRYPSICYTTWCSEKYKIYSIIPFASGTTVPGTQSWNWYGQAPDAPSNVSVTNSTATSLQVNFTDNTYDETNILIERKIGVGGSWTLLGGFGILNKTGNWYWNNTGLSSQTTYCYRLKAVNAVGGSPYSNEACGTTL